MGNAKSLAERISNNEAVNLADNDEATGIEAGLMSIAHHDKLDGIETGATADQTGAEIKVAYEAELDTNAYTDAEKSKLAAVEAGALAITW
jgi:hypothetical protein